MSRLLITGCEQVLEDARAAPRGNVDILIEDGEVRLLTPAGNVPSSLRSGARLIDGRGRLVVPGLVNAHMHSPAALMPGVMDMLSHPGFMWMNQADTAGRTPREVEVSALLADAQMLLSGTTAAIDHFPAQNFGPEDIAAVMRAHAASGMRIVLGLRVFDDEFTDILPDELPGDVAKLLADNPPLPPMPLALTRELTADAIREWHGRLGRLQVFPSPSNPGRCSDALLEMCGEFARAHDLGIHTHLLETKVQTAIARKRYGMTMVEHLDRLGLLDERLSCAHSVWVSPSDIELMAVRGAVVVHNPESNLKIAAGTAPVPAMRRAGVTVALGTDGQGTNDNLSMHESMRFAAMLHRVSEPKRADWVSAADALAMATEGGAAAIRMRGRLGRIAPGQRADLVLHDLAHPNWTPLNDPAQQLVFGENGASVHTVIVEGEVVVEAGRPTRFDLDSLLAEARPMLAAIRARNPGLNRIARRMCELFP